MNENRTNGIDVSVYQGKIDFKKVKQSGIDFVIIKAGEKHSEHSSFLEDYNNAMDAGLHVGAYWFSRALSADDAREEASYCIRTISGKKFDYPIYFDMEKIEQFEKGKTVCSDMVDAFCSTLNKAGYLSGLYISRSPLQTYISDDIAKKYPLWIAEYSESGCHYDGDIGIWQHSCKGTCDGISGYVDLDYGYVDYPSYIIEHGLNGYGT